MKIDVKTKDVASLREQLMQEVRYDQETGEFWRLKTRAKNAKARADHMMNLGYRRVQIGSERIYAHRLAWLFVHGEWPPREVDHINRDKADNRIINLRLADRVENCSNLRQAAGSTGLYGAHACKHTRRFRASVTHKMKAVHVGYFDTAEQANKAAIMKKRELCGEFVPVEFLA